MDNPKPSSSMLGALRSPSVILRHQRSASAGDIHNSSPLKCESVQDIPHADTSEDLSDLMPLLPASVRNSTPMSFKYLSSVSDVKLEDDDPFSTPVHTDSSGDRSLNTPSTAPQSTSSMEIFLGPQPLPFIHHRRRLLLEEYNPSPCRTKGVEQPPLKTHKGIAIVPGQAGDTNMQHQDTALGQPVLSKWRTGQLKKPKNIQPVASARERPVPLLHGPLSLPYARNPSGVDATVADQSAYLSHVFGLRISNSPGGKSSVKGSTGPRSRNASDSTTARTVSSSSYVSSGATSDNTAASGISYASSSRRPIVVRDHNQVIGIKKDVLLPPPEPTVADPVHYAKANEALKFVDGRSRLGLGQPLMPIAGSPSKTMQRYDEAIHSASAPMWTPGKPEFKTMTLVDPTTNQAYTVRVVQQGESESRVVSGDSTLSSKLGIPAHASSKADASINWRNKSSKPFPLHPSPIFAVPPPSANSSPPNVLSGAPVLTVEHLYEKFGHKKNEALENMSPAMSSRKGDIDTTKSTTQTPSKTLSESTGGKVNIQEPIKASSRRRGRSGASKAHTKTDSATNAKGTPGAGKHLKRSHDEENTVPKSVASTPSKKSPRKPRSPRSARKNGSPKKAIKA